ncbi:unnamed protein product [Cuscuta epithymum]|uniref:Uncharacterized protein n=1 Tax=Cuscuta epithymum TaxID=186058 RepID=A0AAV0FL93_9ASTE|nr:unnamed protein product [Cuscuta epithymum]
MNRSSHRCFGSNINIFMAILCIAIIVILFQQGSSSKAQENVFANANLPCGGENSNCTKKSDCYAPCAKNFNGMIPDDCYYLGDYPVKLCCCKPPTRFLAETWK